MWPSIKRLEDLVDSLCVLLHNKAINQWTGWQCPIAAQIVWCEDSMGLALTNPLSADSLKLIWKRSLLLDWRCEKSFWWGWVTRTKSSHNEKYHKLMSCLKSGSAINEPEKRDKLLVSTNQISSNFALKRWEDLIFLISWQNYIWTQSRKWFWLMCRFANLWSLYKCVYWGISLLVCARQTVILCQQELMLE